MEGAGDIEMNKTWLPSLMRLELMEKTNRYMNNYNMAQLVLFIHLISNHVHLSHAKHCRRYLRYHGKQEKEEISSKSVHPPAPYTKHSTWHKDSSQQKK
jgi:hypothetical protein